MNDRPTRVAVTHPRTRAVERSERSALDDGGLPRRSMPDVGESDALSDLAISAIVRAQLALALRYFLTLVGSLFLVPAIVVFVPGVKSAHPFGVPVAWGAFGVLFFPLFLALGIGYRRAAERLENRFVHVVDSR